MKKILALFCIISYSLPLLSSMKIESIDQNKNCLIHIPIELTAGDYIHADSLKVSSNHPDLSLSSWHLSINGVNHYDEEFRETKKIIPTSFEITATIEGSQLPQESAIHVTYYQNKYKKIVEQVFPLHFNSLEENPTHNVVSQTDNQKKTPHTSDIIRESYSAYISRILKGTNQLWVQLLLSLLLGFLLSLTPCIFPMIPITMGILQSQASKSFARNIALASSYTLGIALTFSLLGLLAATTGQLFGSLLQSPITILSIVGILAYLGGSMIGLYEMYMPRWLQNNSSAAQGGSLSSAFLFGAMSGTVASPCLSPGLVLLLTIVTGLQNKLYGFLLLFCFGIGLSIPLLLLGAFSSSINLLPRAGNWMVEVKRILGFGMFGICFYFLNTLLPWTILLWAVAFFIAAIGIFYIRIATRTMQSRSLIKQNSGILLIAISLLLCAKSYQITYFEVPETPSCWLNDYAVAKQRAQKEHKKIILDVSAPFCSICRAIDKKIFTDKHVVEKLDCFVPIKIDNLDAANEIHASLRDRFNIVGVPALLVIDPHNETEIKRWGSELYEESPQAFITELEALA